MLLYLHIPFCHRVCPYCSFYKHTPGTTSIRRFVDAISAEVKSRLTRQPRTLYLGGGTPSMLSPSHLTQLFTALHATIDFSLLEEVTLEANPATFDLAKAKLFRQLGVTRVSLGIQSFTPHVLTTLGREHSVAQASEAVHLLRQAEIPSINIDLMFSIPGQSLGDWQATLEHTLALQPDHISAYNLTYEEDTAFFESLRRGEMRENEDHDAEHFQLADTLLSAAGFDHYETSNYARPGHHSRHNQGYWRGEDYLGLGPSAISTLDGVRWKNLPDTPGYIQQVESLGHALVESETLDAEAHRLERIALGLRTKQGISLDLLSPEACHRAHHFATEGLAQIHDGRLILVHHGRALVDPIAAELI
jgi:oxygen-independent coproporphyrinogen III oxidase